MMLYRAAILGGFILATLVTSPRAQQVQSYSYDVHGRLVGVHSSTGAPSQKTTYDLDNANNRNSRVVSDHSSMGLGASFVSQTNTNDQVELNTTYSQAQNNNEKPKDLVAPAAEQQGEGTKG